jgi:ribosomal protein S18 acetylase RimI-like enzyme
MKEMQTLYTSAAVIPRGAMAGVVSAGTAGARARRWESLSFPGRHLRPACETDIEAILAIQREVFPRRAFSRSRLRCWLRCPRALTMLARPSGVPAGFVAVSWRRGASTCRIVDLAVRRRFRGAGLGRALARAALAFGHREGYAGVTLEVAERNHVARSLYAALGFEVERRLPHYYEKGCHAVRMVRWFRPGW